MPPYDKSVKGIDIASKDVYKLLLEAREKKISLLSKLRSFRIEIEKINHFFAEQFFQAFRNLNEILTDEFLQRILQQKNFKHNISYLKEQKKFCIDKISKNWAEFYNELSQDVQILGEDSHFSSYKNQFEIYRQNVETKFLAFKEKNSLFFSSANAYFSEILN